MPGVQTYPTVAEIDQAEATLKDELQNRAVNQISEIQNDDSIHVRDILPEADLNVGADNGWNGTDREWTQTGLAGSAVEEVYSVEPNNRAENKVIGIYAFSNVAASPLTSEIIFEDGTGSVFERAQVEEVFARTDDTVAVMEEPIILNATDTATISQWATSAGDDEVVYHGAVAEKKGNTLGERQTQQGTPVPGRSPRA